MINLELRERLGNQLFQYAFVRTLSIQTGRQIIVNTTRIYQKGKEEANESWKDSLVDFNVAHFERTNSKGNFLLQKGSLMQKFWLAFFKIYKRIFKGKNLYSIRKCELSIANILSRKGIYFMDIGYYEFRESKAKNILVKGYFEDPRYFENIKDILKKEFTPKLPALDRNEQIYMQIKNTNSVCISIRTFKELRSHDAFYKRYSVTKPDFYDRAINLMSRLVDCPTFLVFSDDIEWVKINMHFPVDVIHFQDNKNPVWENFRLMYSCKHFIVSNSTFSWWAQYLGDYQDKIVIGPRKWFNDLHDSDLILESWIKI